MQAVGAIDQQYSDSCDASSGAGGRSARPGKPIQANVDFGKKQGQP
jgi:hypothetical protein